MVKHAKFFPFAMDNRNQVLFANLYDQYAPILYGLLLHCLNDEMAAQHLLELTFLKAQHQLDIIPLQHKLSWLLNLAYQSGFQLNEPLVNR